MGYDIIGDIHGHAGALQGLLASLGYGKRDGAWRHPDRQAIFVGDFIDRGPGQIETVDMVRRMVDAGSARAVMGNHEFNAIAWFMPDPAVPGEYLRPHHSPWYGEKNYKQHQEFLTAVNGTPKHQEIIDWFMTLPLWLDLVGIRVVHACWHPGFMDYLGPRLAGGNRLTPELMVEASREPAGEAQRDGAAPSVYSAVETLTKGMEVSLPAPHYFLDKDGNRRDQVRVRWWDANANTFRRAALLDDVDRSKLPEEPIPDYALVGHDGGSPVFVGHYWLSGPPVCLSDKVACVDYSIAKGGKLVAYRWDGEATLAPNKFHWVEA